MTNKDASEGTLAAESAPVATEGRVLLAVAIVLGHAIKHVYIEGFQSIILPEIKIGLGLSNTMLGGLATARQSTSGVTTLAAGYIGDRYSRYASIILGVSIGLMGLSYFLVGAAPNYWLMMGPMLLVGLGPSLYHPPAVGALSRRFPERRGFVISLHGTGGSIGQSAGPLVAAAAVVVLAWRATLQWSIIPAFVFAAIVWLMVRSVVAPEGGGPSSFRSYFGSISALLKNRVLLALLAISAVRGMGLSAIQLFLPVYLREDLEFSVARLAVYLTLTQVAGIGAQPVMGVLSDRFGRKAVLVPSMVAFGILLIALKYVEPGAQMIAVILALGMFMYSLQAIFLAAASDIGSAELQSTMVSLIYTSTFMSSTISPILAGLVADSFGVSSTFLYAAALFLTGAVGMAFLRLPKSVSQIAGPPPQSRSSG